MSRAEIKSTKRWVIKVGSALLTDDGAGLDSARINDLARQMVELREQDVEIVLVSSGSIVAGMAQLGIQNRPERVSLLQATAAVGQASLVRSYEEAFASSGIQIAQVLLTHSDIANRERYLNAKSTLAALLDLKVLTVVNENDTVATEEICFGDNDSLAALVANLVNAELLVILTDQEGLYSSDPRVDDSAVLVEEAMAGDESLLAMASGGSKHGRGGMITKLTAAQKASRSGAATVIANGKLDNVLLKVQRGESCGTYLSATHRLNSKKQWLASQMKLSGSITIDWGAKEVLISKGKSLLPVGVTDVTGDFSRGELVNVEDPDGNVIARGITNYNESDARKIAGAPSDRFSDLIGYRGDDEIIHRDNLVLV
jgi:glutamate 5-kinase